MIPKAFGKAGGSSIRPKIIIVSNLMWHMMQDRKNTKTKEGECPFLDQDTENITYTHPNLFWNNERGVRLKISLDNNFNFEGGLSPKIGMLQTQRTKDWPQCWTKRIIGCSNKNLSSAWEHFLHFVGIKNMPG